MFFLNIACPNRCLPYARNLWHIGIEMLECRRVWVHLDHLWSYLTFWVAPRPEARTVKACLSKLRQRNPKSFILEEVSWLAVQNQILQCVRLDSRTPESDYSLLSKTNAYFKYGPWTITGWQPAKQYTVDQPVLQEEPDNVMVWCFAYHFIAYHGTLQFKVSCRSFICGRLAKLLSLHPYLWEVLNLCYFQW